MLLSCFGSLLEFKKFLIRAQNKCELGLINTNLGNYIPKRRICSNKGTRALRLRLSGQNKKSKMQLMRFRPFGTSSNIANRGHSNIAFCKITFP